MYGEKLPPHIIRCSLFCASFTFAHCCDHEKKCARSPKNPAARFSGIVPHPTRVITARVCVDRRAFVAWLFCLSCAEAPQKRESGYYRDMIVYWFWFIQWLSRILKDVTKPFRDIVCVLQWILISKRLEWMSRASYIVAFRFNDKLSWDMCIQMAASWDKWLISGYRKLGKVCVTGCPAQTECVPNWSHCLTLTPKTIRLVNVFSFRFRWYKKSSVAKLFLPNIIVQMLFIIICH